MKIFFFDRRSTPLLWLSFFAFASTFLALSSAAADGPFLQQLTLGDGRVVVVAEAALEPRSIGSYSVRLYSGANPDFPVDDFLYGVVLPRNGYVERLVLADIDGDGEADLVVVIRSAGSGDYVSARALSLSDGAIRTVGQVDDLAPAADPIEQLRQ